MGILRELGLFQMTERRFARIPESVLLDPELCPTDIKIYGVLTLHVYEGNIACMGQRRIAKLANVDRRTVRRSLDSLARHGHISVSVVKLLKRSVFQINSPIFGQLASVELGGETRPQVGVVARPRIDTRSTRPAIRRVK